MAHRVVGCNTRRPGGAERAAFSGPVSSLDFRGERLRRPRRQAATPQPGEDALGDGDGTLKAEEAWGLIGTGERSLGSTEGVEDLVGRLFAHPGTIYSAGQRQRVVLARALYRKRRVRPWAPATSGASSGARLRLAGARSAP